MSRTSLCIAIEAELQLSANKSKHSNCKAGFLGISSFQLFQSGNCNGSADRCTLPKLQVPVFCCSCGITVCIEFIGHCSGVVPASPVGDERGLS